MRAIQLAIPAELMYCLDQCSSTFFYVVYLLRFSKTLYTPQKILARVSGVDFFCRSDFSCLDLGEIGPNLARM